MSEMQSRVSPIVAIAAGSVIIFSIIGVGVMTGVIPSSRSTETAVPAPAVAPAPAQAPAPKAAQAPANKPTQVASRSSSSASKEVPPRVAVAEPAAAPVPPPAASSPPAPVAAAPAPRVCADCGVIDNIKVVEQKGEGSAIGVAGGAVVGGLLGNQVGSGRGNTVATVVGAVGGALAGNEIEKRVKSTKQYNVAVRMDDGKLKTFTFDSAPAFAVGEKVKVVDGKIIKS